MSTAAILLLTLFVVCLVVFVIGMWKNNDACICGSFAVGMVTLFCGLFLFCGTTTWKTATFETKEYTAAATENYVLVESFGLTKQFDSIKDKNILEKNGKVYINQSVNHYGAGNGTWISLEPPK
jgi:hypothetical protein